MDRGGSVEKLCRGQVYAGNREGGAVDKWSRRALQVPQGERALATPPATPTISRDREFNYGMWGEVTLRARDVAASALPA